MRVPAAIALMLVTAALLAACSGATSGGVTSPAPAATAAAQPSAEAPSASTSSDGRYGSGDVSSPAAGGGSGAAAVALGDTSLGTVLVDGKGMTLYMFTPDTGGSSTCYDDCAASWPPLLASGTPTLGEGLAAEDFGTTSRTDGTTQVTFNGLPLYYFAGDTAAGDVNGQGLGGKWYVLDAEGQPIK